MQEVDATRRLAILRGEAPPPLEDDDNEPQDGGDDATPRAGPHGGRRKRKRAGEDDTDFEMRIANERNEKPQTALEATKKPTSSAPIVDHQGHIDLFGDERARAHAEKNEDVEREKKKKKQEFEDQYTMRFAKAAGKDGIGNPWYSQSEATPTTSSKDVWGNDDPTRRGRDAQRMVSNDPLAMMKLGASKVREVKAERRKAQAEQNEELRKLQREQHHEHRRKEHRSRDHRRRSSRSRSRDRSRKDSPGHTKHRSHSRRHDERSHDKHDRRRYDDEDAKRRRRHSRERHHDPEGSHSRTGTSRQ